MQAPVTHICQYENSNCVSFEKIDDQIIKLVNQHYYDLQMYANYIFDIDSNRAKLSPTHNFLTQIQEARNKYESKSPGPLFAPEQMKSLRKLVDQMLHKLRSNWIKSSQYVNDLSDITFFAAGAASPTILVRANRKTGNSIMPIIIKIVPLEFPHHYVHITSLPGVEPSARVRGDSALPNQGSLPECAAGACSSLPPNKLGEFIQTYVRAPSYALFLKEAWMYCFSKTRLAKYTPTFTCIANCSLVEGLPVDSVGNLISSFDTYAQKRIRQGQSIPYKKWFSILANPNEPQVIREEIVEAKYGCFEMGQIDGTWVDLLQNKDKFDLGMIFEYLYTKLVAAFIGRIIFTDDHFDNVGYVKVNHIRAYHIKCNGCTHHFYIGSDKLVQFIDLERYVFNFSPYDIYTNQVLKFIPNSEYQFNKRLEKVKHSYTNNAYIADKSLGTLRSYDINASDYSDPSEFYVAQQLLANVFVYDIRTFCQIMEATLPPAYMTKPNTDSVQVVDYYLDLDNDKLRVIDQKGVYRNL